MNFAFYGTDSFSVVILNELKSAGFLPKLVVTAPDRPAGRGQKMHKPEAKIWAEENNIDVLQPTKLGSEFNTQLKGYFDGKTEKWDLFLLASYGRIVPGETLNIPEKGVLNVHPSLLPQYRGASPIESAMLDDNKDTGVTIMLMDAKMDHGPILDQEFVSFDEWEPRVNIEIKLAKIGGRMLAEIIPNWLSGNIEEQEQTHEMATFTKKITKENGLIEFADLEKLINFEKGLNNQTLKPEKQREIFLKVMALNPWPGAHFLIKHQGDDLRVKITSAEWVNDKLKILNVIPAGRKEMSWNSFIDGFVK